MTRLFIQASSVGFDGEVDVSKPVRCEVSGFMNDAAGGPVPSLAISICNPGKDGVGFYVDGIDQIDALRRHCEMVVDHYRQNILK